jgi:hypothetical protein
MFVWEEYASDLFVERKQDVSHLLDWANAPSVPKQVKSLVAPPGAGKTWILQAVRERLERRAHPTAPPERLVIFCDAPRLVNREPTSPLWNNSEIFKWLEEIREKAISLHCSVDPIERSGLVEIAALVQRLVSELCERCALTHPVIVLVDGLDEVKSDQAQQVEEQILKPFVERQCVRMIIAHRDEDALWRGLRNDTLRRNNGEQSRYRLSDLPSVDEQFQKFRDKFHPTATHLTTANLDQFKHSLTHYQWNHPYINAFLFDKARARTDITDVTKLLTADDLRECLFAVIERRDASGTPRFGELKKETFDCLKRIAKELPDDWTLTDLEKLGLKEQDERIKQLFQYGVVFYNPGIKRYQLADGLRELARDLTERGG